MADRSMPSGGTRDERFMAGESESESGSVVVAGARSAVALDETRGRDPCLTSEMEEENGFEGHECRGLHPSTHPMPMHSYDGDSQAWPGSGGGSSPKCASGQSGGIGSIPFRRKVQPIRLPFGRITSAPATTMTVGSMNRYQVVLTLL